MTRADLEKKPAEVQAMFDDVAPRYDLTNDVLSLGQDRRWRHQVVEAVDPQPGEHVLDLAAGTGTSSQPFLDRGARVVPCDFSVGMLRVGKQHRPHLPFTAGDATRLPFADDTFDAVTISFGLRNIVDPDAGLREMLRVTRPGGRLVVCEFSSPTWSPFRTVYIEYLMRALPTVARAVSSSPDAYVYLAESIRAWPDQPGLADAYRPGRLEAPRVAQPLRRHRRPAPRKQPHRAPAPPARALHAQHRGVHTEHVAVGVQEPGRLEVAHLGDVVDGLELRQVVVLEGHALVLELLHLLLDVLDGPAHRRALRAGATGRGSSTSVVPPSRANIALPFDSFESLVLEPEPSPRRTSWPGRRPRPGASRPLRCWRGT